MARINVEEVFWNDPRIGNLVEKIGRRMAYGTMLDLWRLAQNYYKKEKSPIPREIYESGAFPECLEQIGLVFRTEDGGAYVADSEGHFSWLLGRQTAGKEGGQKSAESRRLKQIEANRSKSKQAEANRSKPNPLTLTLTSNTSNSTSSCSSNTVDVPASKTATTKRNPVEDFENRMRGGEEAWKKVLIEIYGNNRPDSMLMNNIPRFIRHYGKDFELFKSEMEEIWQLSEGKNDERAYLTVAIKKQIGILTAAEAPL